MSRPPFDLVFCRDDPDGEVAFVFDRETLSRVKDLFPELDWTKHDTGWWVAGVYRDDAFTMAPVADKAGLRAAFGEFRDGALVFSRVETLTQH
jgi:hypothetical protein